MVINKYIVIYYIFLFCSVAVGLLGGITGLAAISRWRPSLPHEVRFSLEKKLYLSSTAIFFGSVLRLVMLPLWFLMLANLIPIIPGAMCLLGVHQNVPVYSWLASAMKIFLPLLYFSWISITLVDRKFVGQPFLRCRHLLLLPTSIFILAEALIDLKYITSVKAITVSCCTTSLNSNSYASQALSAANHWLFVTIFCVGLAAQILSFTLPAKRSIYLFGIINSLLLLITLPLGLHHELSPLFSGLILHKCIFCLLQDNGLVMTGAIFLLAGIYLSFTYSVLSLTSIGKEPIAQIKTSLAKIKIYTLAAFALGFAIILMPLITSLTPR